MIYSNFNIDKGFAFSQDEKNDDISRRKYQN